MRILCALLTWAFALPAQSVEQKVATVLEKNCFTCHGAALQMSKLDLRTRESMIKGGERGPALTPGQPGKSPLFLHASGALTPSMPPGKTLPAPDLAVLQEWILSGAPWRASTAAPKETQEKLAALAKLEERPITSEERKFWAFQPVKRPDPPASAFANPIDRFLDAARRAKGVTAQRPADRRTLARRLYLDVTGLPPSPAEVEAFASSTDPQAYRKLVDQLLASPHYGERWGRHWLDLVRYADSAGYEFDRDRKHAYRYRDYVVASLNEDKPYDQFIKEQLAGDEIMPGSPIGYVATGYLRLGPEANIATEQTRMDELDDILATTSGTFLGMTVGCARCHNHKFDPIPQKDYYRMQAVFFPATGRDVPIVPAAELARFQAEQEHWKAQMDPLEKRLREIEKPYRDRIRAEKIALLPDYVQLALKTPPEKRTEGQRLNATQVERTLVVSRGEIEWIMTAADQAEACRLRESIVSLEAQRPSVETALSVEEKKGASPEASHFLHHGSVDNKGTRMEPGVLSVAAVREPRFPTPDPHAKTSQRRRAFAEWIASPENPLTARVMVNRLWQHHFGEGIVRTPSNFGKTGERPTHPELLDWLASEFVRSGWSWKAMHRLMLTSAAYQMSSDDIAANRALDLDNRLLWRQARRRLEGEIIRDSILAVSGKLDRKMGGPGVYPYIDPSLWAGSSGRVWPGQTEDDPATYRRSLYIFQKRTIPLPMMEVFDKPDSNLACSRRNRSTIPTQALILMNNSFVRSQAQFFAQRVRAEAGPSAGAQVERAYQLALLRRPSARERELGVRFVQQDPEALADFCQTLFNLNEFAYLP
jgi:hypothetical protein